MITEYAIKVINENIKSKEDWLDVCFSGINNNSKKLQTISKCTHLKSLALNGNRLTDINFLKDLTGLQPVNLTSNKVQDISVLKNLKYLKDIRLWNNPIKDILALKELIKLETIDINFHYLPYPPIWYVYLKHKKGKLGDYTNLSELPEVEKIWQIMQNGDKENMNLAHEIALGQGWTEEDFEAYRSLL